MKTLTYCSKKCFLMLIVITIVVLGCKKEINLAKQPDQIYSINNNEGNQKKLYVSDINEFYAAINDPENAGSIIVLSPGTYVLNASFPNAGRIELQNDMSLLGVPGAADQVIIDASALPGNSFILPPTSFGNGRTGAIRIGNGTNAIEWLTVKGPPNANALSTIETDLVTTTQTQVRIAHCIISGGQIGIDIRNRDDLSNGRTIEAEIIGNELFGNTFGFGQGIGIQNSRDVSNATINAILRDNYVHDNRMGARIYNVVANNSTITVQSNADRFEQNGLGLSLISAFNEYQIYTANGNVLSFTAHGTIINNNLGVPAPPTGTAQILPGGVLLTGGQVSVNSLPGTVNNNKLNVSFYGCSFSGNLEPYDINAFGARSTYPSSNPAGTNNVVDLKLMGTSAVATVNAIASFPSEPAGTNLVNVSR